ncbi:ComEA family DNA-binding protein [Nocardioides donggukensis]|uniref:ComEA family DNA-binding protein n=1 Tax=Nocardioides donggukensis TaxID=2774019 RepID=A0A927K524_9ACTN|nr:ComEA family DNA-binding protein [Nocardioides donggukensis]MBD8870036.1 ComEA family DNA-binding protein [Nocardioides donggukensis]
MPSRAHQDTVARRLELLTTELDHVRRAGAGPDPGDHPPPEAPRPVPVPVPGRHAARRSVAGRLWSARTALGPGQLAAVAVVVAIGLALTAWWVVREGGSTALAPADPRASALVTPLSPGATASGPAVPSADQAASAAGPAAGSDVAVDVVVDVAGKVRRPGIVVLEPGSRVVDALEAAGGARRGVDLAALNLARPLVDGEQILVGIRPLPGPAASAAGAPGSPAGPATPAALININTAGPEELDELPGVGPVTAAAILDWRTANGGFRSVDQLLDVDGIGEATLADLAPLVTIG